MSRFWKSQEQNNTSLPLCLCELACVSSCWRGTLVWYLLCFGDTSYWVEIAAVKKICINHEAPLTLGAKVRGKGQAEKWRQGRNRVERVEKCQRKHLTKKEERGNLFKLTARERESGPRGGKRSWVQEGKKHLTKGAKCGRVIKLSARRGVYLVN